MSPEAQRIAIALACGWTRLTADLPDNLHVWNDPEGNMQPESMIPNYTGNLNAIHEVEMLLTAYQRQKHGQQLQEILNESAVGFVEDYARQLASLSRVASATAAQRAEALLKSLNKWDDSE